MTLQLKPNDWLVLSLAFDPHSSKRVEQRLRVVHVNLLRYTVLVENEVGMVYELPMGAVAELLVRVEPAHGLPEEP